MTDGPPDPAFTRGALLLQKLLSVDTSARERRLTAAEARLVELIPKFWERAQLVVLLRRHGGDPDPQINWASELNNDFIAEATEVALVMAVAADDKLRQVRAAMEERADE